MNDSEQSQAHDDVRSTNASATGAPSPTIAMMDSVVALGPEKLTGLAGMLLILIGYFAPLATAQTGGFFSSGGTISYSLDQAGFSGLLILVLGVALALLPFYKERLTFANRDLIAYGISCGVFGTFAVLWLASLSLPAIVSSLGGLSGGFYALVIGFGFTVYATAKVLKSDARRSNP